MQSLAEIGFRVAAHVEEIVFDYDPSSLGHRGLGDPRQLIIAHAQEDLLDASGDVISERGGFAIATLNAALPAMTFNTDSVWYPGACVRDPAPATLGMSRGLFVSAGQRFVPALAFRRIRTQEDAAKGPGVMLRISFDSAQPAQPFAIGQFSHFGLGLLAPVAPLLSRA